MKKRDFAGLGTGATRARRRPSAEGKKKGPTFEERVKGYRDFPERGTNYRVIDKEKVACGERNKKQGVGSRRDRAQTRSPQGVWEKISA